MSDNTAPAWETSKENVQPIKRGRRVEALNAALERPQALRGSLQQFRQSFEDSISASSGLAALEQWIRYVDWIKTSYPSNAVENGLLEVLERATRSFSDDASMRDNVDYVKLWISYADLLPDPADVFKYMNSPDVKIGSRTSLFYISWAWLAEHRSNYAFAAKVYERGVALKASPLDRLMARQHEFMRRMWRKWQTAQNVPATAPTSADLKSVDLEALSRLATARATGNVAAAALPTAGNIENSENVGGGSNARAALMHISDGAASRSHRLALTAHEAVALSEASSGGRPPQQQQQQQRSGSIATSATAAGGGGGSSSASTSFVYTDAEFQQQSLPPSVSGASRRGGVGAAAAAASSAVEASTTYTSAGSRAGFIFSVPIHDELAYGGGGGGGGGGSGKSSKTHPSSALPTAAESAKENHMKPSQWTLTSSVLPSHAGVLPIGSAAAGSSSFSTSSTVAAASSKLQVYVDDECLAPPAAASKGSSGSAPLMPSILGPVPLSQRSATASLSSTLLMPSSSSTAPVSTIISSGGNLGEGDFEKDSSTSATTIVATLLSNPLARYNIGSSATATSAASRAGGGAVGAVKPSHPAGSSAVTKLATKNEAAPSTASTISESRGSSSSKLAAATAALPHSVAASSAEPTSGAVDDEGSDATPEMSYEEERARLWFSRQQRAVMKSGHPARPSPPTKSAAAAAVAPLSNLVNIRTGPIPLMEAASGTLAKSPVMSPAAAAAVDVVRLLRNSKLLHNVAPAGTVLGAKEEATKKDSSPVTLTDRHRKGWEGGDPIVEARKTTIRSPPTPVNSGGSPSDKTASFSLLQQLFDDEEDGGGIERGARGVIPATAAAVGHAAPVAVLRGNARLDLQLHNGLMPPPSQSAARSHASAATATFSILPPDVSCIAYRKDDDLTSASGSLLSSPSDERSILHTAEIPLLPPATHGPLPFASGGAVKGPLEGGRLRAPAPFAIFSDDDDDDDAADEAAAATAATIADSENKRVAAPLGLAGKATTALTAATNKGSLGLGQQSRAPLGLCDMSSFPPPPPPHPATLTPAVPLFRSTVKNGKATAVPLDNGVFLRSDGKHPISTLGGGAAANPRNQAAATPSSPNAAGLSPSAFYRGGADKKSTHTVFNDSSPPSHAPSSFPDDEMTLHSRLALDDMADLFSSSPSRAPAFRQQHAHGLPSISATFSSAIPRGGGRGEATFPGTLQGTAAAPMPPLSVTAGVSSGSSRPLPPGARRLSMHMTSRGGGGGGGASAGASTTSGVAAKPSQKSAPSFAIFED